MQSMVGNISNETLRRQSYIRQQRIMKRNKMIDSFISIDESTIISEEQTHEVCPVVYRCNYRCDITIAGELFMYSADWHSRRLEVYGIIEFDDLFEYGQKELEGNRKMYNFNVEKAMELTKKCRNIDKHQI